MNPEIFGSNIYFNLNELSWSFGSEANQVILRLLGENGLALAAPDLCPRTEGNLVRDPEKTQRRVWLKFTIFSQANETLP